ncbi:MAG: TetR/AcrR family transcriptional regulator, partial [Paracoccaceae bacterium]
MQDENRRTNKERSDTMRAGLIAAARDLFLRHGFAATGTPEIVAAAGVTRGALYHHFADKTALFDAVILAEANAIATAVRDADFTGLSPVDGMIKGGEAFLAAMQTPGRTRLMLVDAPAVLGLVRLAEIDAETGGGTIAEGLAHLLPPGQPLKQISALLSAMFDRAAVAIDAGQDAQPWQAALTAVICGIAS